MEKFSLGTSLTIRNWKVLPASLPIHPESLRETLVGGQAFQWYRVEQAKCWAGTWDGHAAALRTDANGNLEAASLNPATSLEDIRFYLGADRLPALIARLPCNADPVLGELQERWRSLSLLRQSPAETLLAFICSSNKRILHIRSMLEALAERFGDPVPGTPFRELPSWERLASVPEADLRACGLGYRAAHVAGTARFIKENRGFAESLAKMSTEAARIALRRLPGIGPKVADCILLFGYSRTEVFPVDTWIDRILRERYPALANWNRAQLTAFAEIHFGPAAGLAQQWLFAEARNPR